MRFVLLGMMTVVLCGCVVDKTTKLKSSGTGDSSSAVKMPDGKAGIAMSKDDLAAKSDIPLYPGADVPEGQSNVTKQGSETRYELDMDTADSPDKVADFFKSKLKVDKSVNGGEIDMLGTTSTGKLVDIKIGKKDGKTHVKAVSLAES